MSTDEYKRHAYARAILAELRRHLLERFVGQGGPAKSQLVCEDVFYVDRAVPEDAIFEILDRLERLELEERARMMQFEIRRREPAEPKSPSSKERPRPRPTAKRKASRHQAPPAAESSDAKE